MSPSIERRNTIHGGAIISLKVVKDKPVKKTDKSAEKAIVHVNDLEEVESSDSTETSFELFCY